MVQARGTQVFRRRQADPAFDHSVQPLAADTAARGQFGYAQLPVGRGGAKAFEQLLLGARGQGAGVFGVRLVRGRVQRLLANTVGGVVQPGKDIVEIVPLDDALVLEARVSPKDIAYVKVGQFGWRPRPSRDKAPAV